MAKNQGCSHFVQRPITKRYRATNDPTFEKRFFARNEDRARRELVRDTLGKVIAKPRSRLRRAKLNPDSPKLKIDKAVQRALLRKLRDPASNPTLASSVSMRQLRMNMAGSILAMVEGIPLDDLRTFTVMNNKWRFSPADLDMVTAKQLKDRFLTHLRRAGVLNQPGFLIAFLHGEFEPTAGVYALHFHGLATVARAKALADLKSVRRGVPRGWGYDVSPTGSRPIVPKRVRYLLHQVTYLLKAYWPERSVRWTGTRWRRDREHQRIRNPYYVQHLLWLDRQPTTDIAIFNGCRLLASGELRLATPVVGCDRAVLRKGRKLA